MLLEKTTSESRLRLQYARAIADSCPESLFDEIALTGSSARGIATANSDIEINFWVSELPPQQARIRWLESIGVDNLFVHPEPRPDNSYWISGRYQGIELEAGWQTVADLDSALTALIAVKTTEHKALRLAELVLSAQSLRGAGVLGKWQAILQHYPSELSHKLILDALSEWHSEIDTWLENRLNNRDFGADSHRIWRVIFALNQQWEINWKYAHYSLDALQIYPNNMMSRIWEIENAQVSEATRLMINLVIDVLELIRTKLPTMPLLAETLTAYRAIAKGAKNT